MTTTRLQHKAEAMVKVQRSVRLMRPLYIPPRVTASGGSALVREPSRRPVLHVRCLASTCSTVGRRQRAYITEPGHYDGEIAPLRNYRGALSGAS